MISDWTDLTGQTLKGYELLELIGKGGFGSVYRAYQPIIDREVALKIILPEHANDPEFVRRFEFEAQLIARLEHIHIIPLYDFWREPGMACLVTRLMKGGSLHNSIEKQGPWSLVATARLLEHIADALQVAHRNGIIHRDIKPANILLDEDQNAFLADFGIAKKLYGDLSSTPDDDRYGSPAFVAPEQVYGDAVSPQTDIYSLGVVVYVMLTGQLPFWDKSTSTVITRQLRDNLPSIQSVRPDIPKTVDYVLWRATSKHPQGRYSDTLAMAEEFRQAIAPQATTIALAAAAPASTAANIADGKTITLGAPPVVHNPYKGLRAFQLADAGEFFGRESLIQKMTSRINDKRFIGVTGPSGSGKSSLVLAGVIPALQQGAVAGSENWYYITMLPGEHPTRELADSLLSIATKLPDRLNERLLYDDNALAPIIEEILVKQDTQLVLFIDQFEEVFTLVSNESQRMHFLRLLMKGVQNPSSRLRVIVTLRADYYDRPLLYSGFAELMHEGTEVILPLTNVELERAIIRPSELIGIYFEANLVQEIIGSVSQQPGSLPLLQYMLTELFERRDNRTLTFAAYKSMGGVLGTLATRAEEIYQALSPSQQSIARQVFLRLVTLENTRRRIPRNEINFVIPNKHEIQEVLDTFGKVRLLTFDYEPGTRTPTVEIAHEALISVWDRLKRWLESSREDMSRQIRLGQAMDEWARNNQDANFLLSTSRFAPLEPLLKSDVVKLSQTEIDYLERSQRRIQQGQRRRLYLLVGSVIFGLFALALALFAFDRQRISEIERQRADGQTSIARSRELAANAMNVTQPLDLRLLLGLEALSVADTFEAQNSLLSNLRSEPRIDTILHGHTNAVRTVAYSPDGQSIASAGRDNQIILWDTESRREIRTFVGHQDWINNVVFSSTGTTLYSASSDGTLRVWDIGTGRNIATPITLEDEIWGLAISADDQWLAYGTESGVVGILDTETLTAQHTIPEAHTNVVFALAFSPDNASLTSASGDSSIRFWDVMSGEPLTEPLVQHESFVLNVVYSPDGSLVISTGVDARIVLWDGRTGDYLQSIRTGDEQRVRALAINTEGTLLATGSDDGFIRLWNLINGDQIGPSLNAHIGSIWAIRFSSSANKLVSGGEDNRVIVWNTDQSQVMIDRASPQTDNALAFAYSPDSEYYVVAGGLHNGDTGIHVFDSETHQQTSEFNGHTDYVTSVAFSPDGSRLISGSADGTARIWDTNTQETTQVLSLGTSAWVTVAFSPNNRTVATGIANGRIVLWDSDTGEQIGNPLIGHTDGVLTLTFDLIGETLISGSHDTRIIRWDVETGSIIDTPLSAHTDSVTALVFTPDANMLVSASRDRSIVFWDTSNWERSGQPLLGHTDYITSLSFNQDTSLLASGSQDNTIRLWDVREQEQIGLPLTGHNNFVNTVAFNASGDQLVSTGEDELIIIWDMRVSAWQDMACRIANRNLTQQEWDRYFNPLPFHDTCL
jgi:WD40 repeat protein/energy-coupling factor transporter ATP-binding protein EcfA2